MEDSGCKHGRPPVEVACKYCAKVIVAVGGNETCLERHISNCTAKINFETEQMQLIKSSMKSNYMISYDELRTSREVADFVVKNEMPFSFSNDKRFQDLVRTTFCPTFTIFSKSSATNHVMEQFEDEKKKLLTFFNDFEGKVSLSSQLWTSFSGKLQYLSLTAHYVDQNWVLRKIIISFKLIEAPCTGFTLGEALKEEIVAWGLEDKIFSITLDNNAIYNESVVQYLKQNLQLPLNGSLFRLHCCDHVLNLIVKDGLRVIGDSIEKIKNIIVSIHSSNSNIQLYKDACKKAELPYKMLSLGVCTKWNATYTILKVASEYRKAIDSYCFGLPTAEQQQQQQLTDEDWLNANVLRDFLRLFEKSTTVSSDMLYPTSSRVLHQLMNLVYFFDNYEKAEGHNSTVMEEMKKSFKKYWEELPLSLAFAIIMDPRHKIRTFDLTLEFVYGDCLSSTRYISTLRELYEEYKCRMQIDSNATEQESSSSEEDCSYFRIQKKLRREHLADVAKNELQYYLDETFYDHSKKVLGPFDVLAWWKERKHYYPVLTDMARDLFTIPISVIASKAIYSAGDRLLSDYYAQLRPEMIEALICTKDWFHGDAQGIDQ